MVPPAPTVKGPEITPPQVNRYTNLLPAEPIWKIERDLATGAVAVTTGEKARFVLPQGGAMEVDHVAVARTTHARPDAASVHGDTTMRVRLDNIGRLEIHTDSWVTQSGMTLNARITMDGTPVFEKRWSK